MFKYKNVLLICISILLFAYAAFISIVPSAMVKSFNIKQFNEKLTEAIGLDSSIGSFSIKIKPNFIAVVNMTNIDVHFPDNQPVFKAKSAELIMPASSLYSKKYEIKQLNLRYVKYDDLILPDGTNKIGFVPSHINFAPFGKNNITIVSGPVNVKDIDISYTKTKPYSYKKESSRELDFSKEEVREFLNSLDFKHIIVK